MADGTGVRATPHHDLPRRDLHRDGPRRRPGATTQGGAGRRARPQQRAGLAATRSAGRTSTTCSTPASTSSPRSTSSTSSRSTTSSSRSPASPSRRPSQTPSVRAAEQIELVDMTAEALRRRMAHGNIYKPDKVDAALGNYFRVGNLTALRELALLWLADKVDDQLDQYRHDHGIEGTWEARERVVVALTGGPEGDTLIRRAARIAERGARRRPAGRARGPQRGTHRPRPGPPGPPAHPDRDHGRHLPPGRRRRHPRGAAVLRPGRQRHPARPRGQPTRPHRADLLPRHRDHHGAPSPEASTCTWSRTRRPGVPSCAARPPRDVRRWAVCSSASPSPRWSCPADRSR